MISAAFCRPGRPLLSRAATCVSVSGARRKAQVMEHQQLDNLAGLRSARVVDWVSGGLRQRADDTSTLAQKRLDPAADVHGGYQINGSEGACEGAPARASSSTSRASRAAGAIVITSAAQRYQRFSRCWTERKVNFESLLVDLNYAVRAAEIAGRGLIQQAGAADHNCGKLIDPHPDWKARAYSTGGTPRPAAINVNRGLTKVPARPASVARPKAPTVGSSSLKSIATVIDALAFCLIKGDTQTRSAAQIAHTAEAGEAPVSPFASRSARSNSVALSDAHQLTYLPEQIIRALFIENDPAKARFVRETPASADGFELESIDQLGEGAAPAAGRRGRGFARSGAGGHGWSGGPARRK